MKTLRLYNIQNRVALLNAILIILFLYASPGLAWASPESDGDNNTTSLPFEIFSADLEGDLSLEEWMTQPFEISSADLEGDLSLEEWMTLPFELYIAELEEELYIEDWMTRAF